MNHEQLLDRFVNPLLRQCIEQCELVHAFSTNELPPLSPDQMTRIDLLLESLRHTSQLTQELAILLSREVNK